MATLFLCQTEKLDAQKVSDLEKLFGSSGYSTLKEIIVSKCLVEQMHYLQRSMYPDKGQNNEMAEECRKKAEQINAALDLLDDIEKKNQEWAVVTLEPSR